MIQPKTNKIFGGMFGLPIDLESTPTSPIFLHGNPVLLFNARSCINLVVSRIQPHRIWLPSYLTDDILAGINPEVSRKFYPVNSHLGISDDHFISQIQEDDLFLFIDYFGFPFDSSIINKIKSRNCSIFRDCTQALFHNWMVDDCDYYIYAPRKFLGIPDGGILQCKESFIVNQSDFYSPKDETFYKLFSAFIKRREFDKFGGDRRWFELFQEAEEELCTGNQLMSDLSIMLLNYAFDYKEIKHKRRSNYHTLHNKLEKYALFPDENKNAVPIGYPISIKNRDEVRFELFKCHIYPPIHWDIKDFVPERFHESHQLSKSIMTLPCDQRYDEDDMIFIADSFLRIVEP